MISKLKNSKAILDFLSNVDTNEQFELEIQPFSHSCWQPNEDGEYLDSQDFYIEPRFSEAIRNQKSVLTIFKEDSNDGHMLFKAYQANYEDDSIWLTIDHIKSVSFFDNCTSARASKTPLSNAKQLALTGAKLAVGKKASALIQTYIIKKLKILKVPDYILEHKITQLAILIGTPNLLKLVLEFVPNDKIPKKVFTILEAACVSSVAQVSEEVIDLTQGILKPILKELAAINTTALEKENKKLLAKNKD